MTSEHWQIPWVVDLIRQVNPRSVLDVGCGWGKYGTLVREYTEAERVDALDRNLPRYRVYDRVFLGNACSPRTLPKNAPLYDLVLCVDMIEHVHPLEVMPMLRHLSGRARLVLVVSPLGFRRQDAPDVPFGAHLSGWYPWQFVHDFHIEAWRIFPGRFSRHLRLPRSWQFAVLLRRR